LIAHFPPLVHLYHKFSRDYAGGLSLVNFASPRLFQSLTPKEIEAAKESLSRPWHKNPSSEYIRVFDIDAAKVLLLLAAVMYEPNSREFHDALQSLKEAHATDDKHAHHEAVSEVHDAIQGHGTVISAFCEQLGIESAMVSQLNSFSTACAAVFWDHDANWIVVAFRGTSPTEFEEWVDDLKINQVDAGPWLEGFGKVHMGFKNRIFPENADNMDDIKPYESIVNGVRELAQHLLEDNPNETEVNVWFTGHSLGCAMASLAYARAILNPKDFGPTIRIRDAYLFAAPVVCDVVSVEAFNNAIKNTEDRGRTMWRVTNAGDAVATILPEFGDREDLKLSPTNVLAFAHLGVEIKMRDYPMPSIFTGQTLHRKAQVKLASSFTEEQLEALRRNMQAKGAGLSVYERAGLQIPFLGRLLAHGTVFYWDQLSRVGTGPCSWAFN